MKAPPDFTRLLAHIKILCEMHMQSVGGSVSMENCRYAEEVLAQLPIHLPLPTEVFLSEEGFVQLVWGIGARTVCVGCLEGYVLEIDKPSNRSKGELYSRIGKWPWVVTDRIQAVTEQR